MKNHPIDPYASVPPSYREECLKGVDLFEKTFKEYQNSQIPQQKKEYQEIMKKTLEALHQAAGELANKEIQKLELQIEQDYQKYQDNPSDSENISKVNQDLSVFRDRVASFLP